MIADGLPVDGTPDDRGPYELEPRATPVAVDARRHDLRRLEPGAAQHHRRAGARPPARTEGDAVTHPATARVPRGQGAPRGTGPCSSPPPPAPGSASRPRSGAPRRARGSSSATRTSAASPRPPSSSATPSSPRSPCDVTDEAQVQRLFATAEDADRRSRRRGEQRRPRRAGRPRRHDRRAVVEGARRHAQRHVPLHAGRAAHPHDPRGAGAIVNNASVLGWRAQAGQAHYAAAKAGVMALTRCAAIEAAPSGVRVNAVAPSLAMHAVPRQDEQRGAAHRAHRARGLRPRRRTVGGRERDRVPRERLLVVHDGRGPLRVESARLMVAKPSLGATGEPFTIPLEQGKIREYATRDRLVAPRVPRRRRARRSRPTSSPPRSSGRATPGTRGTGSQMSQQRGMHAEQEYVFHGEPPRAGTRLTCDEPDRQDLREDEPQREHAHVRGDGHRVPRRRRHARRRGQDDRGGDEPVETSVT